MVFRRDSKVDAFQRQISALRHQLGGEGESFAAEETDLSPSNFGRVALPDLDLIRGETSYSFIDDYPEPPSGVPDLPVAPDVPAIDAQTSIIAHGTAWNGNLESAGSLHVHGRVDGALTARQDVFIAEEAEVDATLTAANITVAGVVRGAIYCTGRFELLPRGRVSGDIHAPTIVIHDGALMAGEIFMVAKSSASAAAPAAPAMRAARGGD